MRGAPSRVCGDGSGDASRNQANSTNASPKGRPGASTTLRGAYRGNPAQQRPAIESCLVESYPTYFGAAVFHADVACWVLGALLFAPLCVARTLQVLCRCSGPASLAAASTAFRSCPPSIPHGHQPPRIWEPTLLAALVGTTGPAAAQPTLPYAQHVFPCEAGLLTQAAWVLLRSPFVVAQLFLKHGSIEVPLMWLLTSAAAVAAIMRHTSFMRGGRTSLVVAFKAVPRWLTALELLLSPSGPSPITRAFVACTCAGALKASSIMIFTTLMHPLPLAIHLPVALSHLLAAITTEALLLGPAATLPHLLSYSLSTFALGVVLPCLVILPCERSLRRQHTRLAATSPAPDPLPAVASNGLVACPTRGTSSGIVGGGVSPGWQNRLQQVYVRRSTAACVGVKVHHHNAYVMRELITAEVKAAIEAYYIAAPKPTHAPTTATTTSAPGSNGSRARSVARAVSITAVPGCLQLLITVQQLGEVVVVGYDAEWAGEHALSAPAAPAGPLAAPKPSGFPASDAAAGVEELIQEQLAGLPLGLGWKATYSHLPCSTNQAGSTGSLGPQGSLGAAVRRVGVQLTPVCVAAGVEGPQVVGVQVEGLPGWTVEEQGVGAEAMAVCWQGGKEVVVTRPLELEGVEEGAGAVEGVAASCRLRLPPGLDAAPLQVHVVAACLAHEGVLLASTTTMCLPPAAASELLAALPQPPDTDPQLLGSVLGLLEDMAAAWKLLHLGQQGTDTFLTEPAAVHDCVTGMRAYCASEHLPVVDAFLQQLLPPAEDTGGLPPPPTAAALQPRTAAWERQYTAWKLLQGRWVDLLAAVAVLLLWAAVLWKQAHTDDEVPWSAPRSSNAWYAVGHALSMVAPLLLLAVGPNSLRMRRPWVIAVQVASVGTLNLMAAACWVVPIPRRTVDANVVAKVLASALLLPVLQRVNWRQQLLFSFLDELMRHLQLMAVDNCMPGASSVAPPSMWQVWLTPPVAAGVAWAMGRCSRAAFRHMVAQAGLHTPSSTGAKDKAL